MLIDKGAVHFESGVSSFFSYTKIFKDLRLNCFNNLLLTVIKLFLWLCELKYAIMYSVIRFVSATRKISCVSES